MTTPQPIPGALMDALIMLGRWLRHSGYRFITVTPATHARVHRRSPDREANDLSDIFGWSRPFAPALLPSEIRSNLLAADLLFSEGPLLRSRVRFSSLGEQLYAHSAYPTSGADAVFFGPDSHRFVALIEAELSRLQLLAGARILDVGCGAGPGGIAAALLASQGPQSSPASPALQETPPALILADINAHALQYARANAALAGLKRVRFVQGNLFELLQESFDLVVANPPYLVDAAARTYRHGGGALGGGLSERIVAEGLPRLAPGGRLVLYTGAAIVAGADPLFDAIQPVLQASGFPFTYRELDPDVFGEELDTPAYAQADRIAAVALVVRRPAP